MLNKYRFYLCPKPGCPKVGKKDAKCPDHDLEFKPSILIREKPEIPDALKTPDQRSRDMLGGIFKDLM